MTTIALLRRLFFYVDSHHAEQWRNKSGDVGYSPACDDRFSAECKARGYLCDGCEHKAPTALTDARLQAHLAGKLTLGAYQLREDATAGWLCIDVDTDADTDAARANAKALTRLIAGTFAQIGLPVAVEFTGSKGFHLWLFCPDGAPARDLRRLGEWAVDSVLDAEGDFAGVHAEVFPKQDKLQGLEDYGNLVKVPLGVHKGTGHRCRFVDAELAPHADQAAYLATIQPVTAAQIAEAIEEWVPDEPERPLPAAKGRGRLARSTREYLQDGAGEGERNDRLFRAAADLAGNGYAPEDVEATLLPIAVGTGLSEKEAQATIESALKKERTPSVPGIQQERDHYSLEDGEIIYYRAKPVYSSGQRIGTDWIPTLVTNFSAEFEREVVEMDGDDHTSVYAIVGTAPDRRFRVELDAEEFRDERKCRGLVGAAAGARAMIHSPKHLPLAIQALSNCFDVELRYLSTGWQLVDGELAFLTPGAAPLLCAVEAECRRYHVAAGDTAAGLDALCNGLLEAFPHSVTYFAVAHAFLAPLYRWMPTAKRYALHLVGETGALKTAYACALLTLYGPDFVSEEPTDTWRSTWKKLEVLGHQAKDVLFLIDDYKLRYVRMSEVTQLLHNYSESRGRGRLNRDATIQGTQWIRGALLTTGEDVPENEASVVSRMLILRLQRPVGTNTALAYAQERGASLSAVMHEYTRWLVATMAGQEPHVDRWLTEQRDRLIALCPKTATNPGRLASNVAQNRLAFWTLGRFLCHVGRWMEGELVERLAEYDEYAETLIGEMAERVSAEKASTSYLTAIRALIESGEMVLLPRNRTEGDGEKKVLGWRDPDWIYLQSDIAYQAAERWHRSMGASIGFTRRAVEEQLYDDGHIECNEAGRRTTAVWIGSGRDNGQTKRVLKLRPGALEEAEEYARQEEMPF